MMTITDQLGGAITLPACPQRIISVVPSITELLHYLELEKQVVAVTRFCVHPTQWYKEKIKIGGTKKLLTTKIAELVPELIIANKEENTANDVQLLKQICAVWVSEVKTLTDALHMIEAIGKLCCREAAANALVQDIQLAFDKLRHNRCFRYPPVSTAYLIWRDPYMVAGTDTFISDMMSYCNLSNAFADNQRYPQVDVDTLRNSDCVLILASSEPYPFKEHHIRELKDALPGKTILYVNGDMFSWYGSRLIQAAHYFHELQESIHHTRLGK